MGWCGNCGAEGGKGKQHNKPRQPCLCPKGKCKCKRKKCGRYSLPFTKAKELFLGSDWVD